MNANKKIMGAFEAISSLGAAANSLYDNGIKNGVNSLKKREGAQATAQVKNLGDRQGMQVLEDLGQRWDTYDKAANVMTSSGFKKTMGAGAAATATLGTAYGGYRLMTGGSDRR